MKCKSFYVEDKEYLKLFVALKGRKLSVSEWLRNHIKKDVALIERGSFRWKLKK